ncbi:hypothetical protein OG470_19740 [Micromonospora sp. NBC_00389]|uniref:hypothetical protein n=1 Tax=Micromonospora sp. NBC_00389 TaxID=2903586 RepID=UPI002E233B15
MPYLQENRFSADYELLERFDAVEIERDFELIASWTLSAGPGVPDQVTTTFGQDHAAARAEEARIDALEGVCKKNGSGAETVVGVIGLREQDSLS